MDLGHVSLCCQYSLMYLQYGDSDCSFRSESHAAKRQRRWRHATQLLLTVRVVDESLVPRRNFSKTLMTQCGLLWPRPLDDGAYADSSTARSASHRHTPRAGPSIRARSLRLTSCKSCAVFSAQRYQAAIFQPRAWLEPRAST